MKKIIVLLAATVLFVWAAAAQTKPDTITILHFNDSHSALDQIGPRYDNLRGTRGGIARAATWVRMYRFLEPNILLLHAGDISIGDLFYNTTFGVAELQLMLAMGFDAMTLGNHEFDLTPATFLQSVSAAFAEGSFPLLSANLVLEDPAVQPLKNYVFPYTIKEYGNTKVGIFGLTTPATNLLSSPSPAFVDTNVVQIAAAMVDTLTSKGCNVVICLSHLGVQIDQIVASYVPGIHVIVGGHDHYTLEKPIEVTNPVGGQTLIVQANAFYLNMGKLRLLASGDDVRLIDFELIKVDEQLPSNYDIEDVVAQLKRSIEATYGPLFSQQIGYVTDDLEEVADSLDVPGPKDTPIGNLVTDAFRAATGTDIAFQVGGSTAMQVWHGPIVAADLFRALGYGFNTDNGLGYRLATFTMTGEALWGGLQFGLTKSAQDDNDEFLAQVSGMKYSYQVGQPSGNRDYALTGVTIGGVPIDPGKIYTVTANEFVPMFLSVLGIPFDNLHVFTDTTEFQVLAAYVGQIGTITPATEGRVECLPKVTSTEGVTLSRREAPLMQNYPNPFNPSTTIAFTLPSAAHVTLKVYNLVGQEVKVLMDGQLPAGSHAKIFNAENLPSGTYFYKLTAGDYTDIKRMVLLK